MYYKLYGHTHESIYHGLTMVIPKWFFAFKDFPPELDITHYDHYEQLEYLQKYAEHYDIVKYVNFNTAVVDVAKDTSEKWKVTTQTNSEESVQYFDHVIVCNGHNSIPYYPTGQVVDIDKFEGKVLHTHNIRQTHSEMFEKKSILLVGARWSAIDLMYQLIHDKKPSGSVDFAKIYVLIGDFKFTPFVDNEKVVFMNGHKVEFGANSVKFEDGTEADIDTVVYCTGYKFSFPFIQDENLLQFEEEQRYFGPLFHRIFNINDPTLMFAGQGDNNAIIQVVMEKQIIVAKYFIEGKIKLPSKEDMLADLENDKNEIITSFKNLRNFYKGDVPTQWKYVEQLQKLLKDNSIEPTELNTKFNDTLNEMIKFFGVSLGKNDFVELKTYDYNKLIPDDFEYDTTDYF